MSTKNSEAQLKSGPELVVLPPPAREGGLSLTETLWRRRSVRSFADKALTEAQISQLLFAAQGISDPRRGLRTAPSAGATFPLETYLVTRTGIFHYLPQNHALRRIATGDLRDKLADAALGQEAVRSAPAVIVFAACFERTTARYRSRGERYVWIEVGHAAQNVHLQAVALGLSSVPVGAFEDTAIAQIIGLPAAEKILYLIPVGWAR